MNNLLFFDIDGTLLEPGKREISKEVLKEVRKLKENNEIFICTGRCYHQAKRYIDDLGSSSYITSNGQEVCYKGEIIYQNYFTKDDATEVIDLLKKNNMMWGYETRSNIFIPLSDYAAELNSVLQSYGFLDIKVSNDEMKNGIYQIWLFGEPCEIKKVINKMDKKFETYLWNDRCVEILPGKENKANGIKKIVKKLKLNNIECKTFGFGDGVNDIQMLTEVDESVAMGNACEEVKKVAKYITTPCSEDGIIKGIEMIGLK